MQSEPCTVVFDGMVLGVDRLSRALLLLPLAHCCWFTLEMDHSLSVCHILNQLHCQDCHVEPKYDGYRGSPRTRMLTEHLASACAIAPFLSLYPALATHAFPGL